MNAWDDSREDISGFVKRNKLKQRMLLQGQAVAKKYKVKSVPTTLWIDREGKIIDTELGFAGARVLSAKTARLLSRCK